MKTAPKAGDRTIGSVALDNAKTNGFSNHENLYANEVRRKFKWQVVAFLFIGTFLWDRVQIAMYTHEKTVAPVVLHEDANHRLTMVGIPDPAWKPHDGNVLAELDGLVKKMRGRTVDAQHDRGEWREILNRCTERGCNNLLLAYNKLQEVEDKGRIVVTITNRTKSTDNTFYYAWTEERQNEQGQVSHTYQFRGTFNVVIDVPTTYDVWAKNPSGVWNDGFSVDKEGR